MKEYGLFQDQVEHYGNVLKDFTLDEKINDRGRDYLHRLKLQYEHEDLEQSVLNKLTRRQKAELEYFIKAMT